MTFMFFRQIQSFGDNFSYIIADESSKTAAIIDTSYNAAELVRLINEQQFSLRYIFCTHGHSDHVSGNSAVQAALGGKIVAYKTSRVAADVWVSDGDILHLGSVEVKVLYTPGHTPDGMCLLINGAMLLTGDTLFVGECGRTDMPGGDARSLYDSLFNKLLKLSDEVAVYPGHDYGPAPFSTIGEQRRTNYVLEPRTVDEFITFMQQ